MSSIPYYKRQFSQEAAKKLLSLENIIGTLTMPEEIRSMAKAAGYTTSQSMRSYNQMYVTKMLQKKTFYSRIVQFLCKEKNSDPYWQHFLKALPKGLLILLARIVYSTNQKVVPPPLSYDKAAFRDFLYYNLPILKDQLCRFYEHKNYIPQLITKTKESKAEMDTEEFLINAAIRQSLADEKKRKRELVDQINYYVDQRDFPDIQKELYKKDLEDMILWSPGSSPRRSRSRTEATKARDENEQKLADKMEFTFLLDD